MVLETLDTSVLKKLFSRQTFSVGWSIYWRWVVSFIAVMLVIAVPLVLLSLLFPEASTIYSLIGILAAIPVGLVTLGWSTRYVLVDKTLDPWPLFTNENISTGWRVYWRLLVAILPVFLFLSIVIGGSATGNTLSLILTSLWQILILGWIASRYVIGRIAGPKYGVISVMMTAIDEPKLGKSTGLGFPPKHYILSEEKGLNAELERYREELVMPKIRGVEDEIKQGVDALEKKDLLLSRNDLLLAEEAFGYLDGEGAFKTELSNDAKEAMIQDLRLFAAIGFELGDTCKFFGATDVAPGGRVLARRSCLDAAAELAREHGSQFAEKWKSELKAAQVRIAGEMVAGSLVRHVVEYLILRGFYNSVLFAPSTYRRAVQK